MREFLLAIVAVLVLPPVSGQRAEPGSQPVARFNKVMIVVLENANYADAMAQPFLKQLAAGGALLSTF